jgi:AcrR family transcriptional regulator
MSDSGIVRRSGYWPASPVVGSRGARTRQRIVAEALVLFEQQGFRATSVDSIAKAAGTSRATLYQYFESKEQIFLELIEECGTALRRVARRIGALGPTAAGLENLHWWLGEWAWVYDKYATVFVQWADIEAPGTGVRPLVVGFVESYNAWIAARLEESGVIGLSPGDAALALTSVVHRFNYFRHRRTGLPPAEQAVEGLAVVMQLMLFPDTPPEAFAELPRIDSHGGRARGDGPAVDPGPSPVPPVELSSRAAATVGQIVEAGARLFAEQGYHGTSVDDIVAEAGYARTTFYKYFEEKADLLVRLTDECSQDAAELSRWMARIVPGPDGPAELRRWLTAYLPFYRRYRGVFRAWVEGGSIDPRLSAAAERENARMASAVRAVLDRVERNHPLDLDVATVVFLAVVDRLPEAVEDADGTATDDRLVELLAAVLERGLLNGRPRPGATDGTAQPVR